MKRTLLLLIVLQLCIGGLANDLRLKANRPAEFFEESFVIGNGTQGGIIYGRTDCERISLNDIHFWSGEPDTAVYNPGACRLINDTRSAIAAGDYALAESMQRKMQGHNSQYYMPVGNLYIDFDDKSEETDYRRTLDLNTAIVTTGYSRGGNNILTEYFASAPDSVIAVRLSASEPLNLILRYDSLLPFAVDSHDNMIEAEGFAPYGFVREEADGRKTERMLYDPSRGIHYATNVSVVTRTGRVTAIGGNLRVEDAADLVIFVAIATNFDNTDVNPANSTIDYRRTVKRLTRKAASQAFDDIIRRHLADYNRLFARVSLNLGNSPTELQDADTESRLKAYTDSHNYDPDLEELYFQYGRYLLISCSRTPGIPANLQGLWNEKPAAPWRSNYTININLEENYWPAELTNLSELHMPLLSFVKQLSLNGQVTAREYYGVDKGWCAAHNSDVWAMTCPVGHGDDQPKWANWNMGGAWLSTHLWQHYLFTRDTAFLQEYYPVLKGAAEFCLGWMIEDDDGHLITSPSTSPENWFIAPDGNPAATCSGSYADLAIIRQCLADTRCAAAELGTDKPLVDRIDAALSRLAPYKVGSEGQLQEWSVDFPEYEPTHRHQSHLFGLFPGNHLTLGDTPELAAAAARTLEIKGDNTTGWSTGWRVNLLARLADGEKAYSMYRRLLKYVSPDGYKGMDKRRGGGTYPNLLDAHSPFQIDGNFGGTAGVAEMLMQSTPESISLLPALPVTWSEGSFSGLKARGAFIVGAKWKDGKVSELSISSDVGGNTTLNVNGESLPVAVAAGETLTFAF